MNRDERRTRDERRIIHSQTVGDIQLFYPVDDESGGTWLGVNNQGVILCLLNYYRGQGQSRVIENAKSRGFIIPETLQQGGFSSVYDFLIKLNYQSFNPFELFLICHQHKYHFQWNGMDYHYHEIHSNPWFMFASSAINTEEVVAYRQQLFKDWCTEVGSEINDPDEILKGFHLIQTNGRETHSVLMERENSHTKSIAQVTLDKRKLRLRYFPEILAKTPVEPLTLSIELVH